MTSILNLAIWNKDFLTSYYRDEMKAKGIDADFNVRLGDNYDKEIRLITMLKAR